MYVGFRKKILKNTKLINLFKTFSPPELKKFRDFVNSPYFNKNKKVIKLNNELYSYYPEYDSDELSEEKIYRKVFGGEKYDYFRIKNIISDLYILGLEFLKQQSNIYTDFSGEFNMLSQLRKRKLWKSHAKHIEHLLESFGKAEIKDRFYLYNEHLLISEKQLSIILKTPNSTESLQEYFDSFHDFALLSMLKSYALMIHVGKENRSKFELKMFSDVYNYIQNTDLTGKPLLNVYKFIILLTVNRNEDFYFKLKKLFIENYNSLSDEDTYYTHMYIFGFCMDKYNIEANRKYIKECYELFLHAYQKNFVSLGELLYPDFINYVKVFMRKGDKKITLEFMEANKRKLPDDQYENCMNFSYAYIAHHEGNFTEALALIQKVNFPLTIMKVQVKILQVQLNYELGYFEETRELAGYFKKSIKNEEGISKEHKHSIISFLKNIVTLIDLGLTTNRAAFKLNRVKLMEEIVKSQKNYFGVRIWLEDKLEEMKFSKLNDK
ncbi:MAG TPA: hypothetical protein DCX92_14085 [Bacteroidetes bacterium]|nr:hypothetical protein [Bacteroidota bacterium]